MEGSNDKREGTKFLQSRGHPAHDDDDGDDGEGVITSTRSERPRRHSTRRLYNI